ncbi:hypothetical protein CSB45_09440 [candidate division KSB3 bacterium]|uniref:Uncharacterized protein n=1 Tax=candidate division KSB3 bacterium TaxID=2044937 RepID=A0A2G6E478_9BACT|nr:MAG: hypothetical protein CSB45_09440 [candidate division KSB3 bacterium]PIE29452.1 MAG: hypothetical protein CSA57_08635 [candidate division KSB3 bacterium]
MKNFFRTLLLLIITCVISLIVGMVSPGQWLSTQQRALTKFYHQQLRFRGTAAAENFSSTPYHLQIIYLENTEGKLESYLMNAAKNEMLPILEVEGTTQVGDLSHRFKGLGEEGRGKLTSVLEQMRSDGTDALDKAFEFLGM